MIYRDHKTALILAEVLSQKDKTILEHVYINVVMQAFEKRLYDKIDVNTTSRHRKRHEMTPEKRVIFGGF